MASEIKDELVENYKKMRELMLNQKFRVADAEFFLERYHNVLRRMEQLEQSRDKWATKHLILEHKYKKCTCTK